jgi:serine/threonine protein kinase
MHKNNIVHRDIKLDNLLLDLTNTIKICDFGVSKILFSQNEIMQDHCGTPAYIAPEVFKNLGYHGYGCDIWSLGVTLYFMLGGEQPFKGQSVEELKKNVCLKNYKKIDFISTEAEDLLDKMLTVDPDERITLDEIMKHIWIKDVDIKNRKKLKLFSKYEELLLMKYNACYLKNNTEDLIENFEQENLNTVETEEEKGKTKSIILAPYNTFVTYFNDASGDEYYINKEIKIENNICKYRGGVQVSNIKYQISNNDIFDNGIIKTIQAYSISNLSSLSQNLNTEEIKKSNNLSVDDMNKNNIENNFCEDIIQEIEDKVGFDKNYLIQCLKNDEVNYATATYYLMLKDKEENGK